MAILFLCSVVHYLTPIVTPKRRDAFKLNCVFSLGCLSMFWLFDSDRTTTDRK